MQSNERTHVQRWNDYLCPNGLTLKNLFGVEDPAEWREIEGMAVLVAATQLPLSGFPECGKISEELKMFHREMFFDCYEWAGECRTVTMTKESENNPTLVSVFAQHDEIDEDLEHLDSYVAKLDWGNLKFEDKRDHLALIHCELNRIHPFREGNGRVTCRLMQSFAHRHGVTLNWTDNNQSLKEAAVRSLTNVLNGIDVRPFLALYRDIVATPLYEVDENQEVLFQLTDLALDAVQDSTHISLSLDDVHHQESSGIDPFSSMVSFDEDEDVTELE